MVADSNGRAAGSWDSQSILEMRSLAVAAMDLANRVLRETESTTRVAAKGPNDIVTNVDIAVEEAVRAFLSRESPEICFLGEETGGDAKSELMWTLDPVDGTINFSRGLPTYAISLSLLDAQGALLAIIDAPRLGERYQAARGLGTTLNGTEAHVGDARNIADSVICLDDFAPDQDTTAARSAIFSALAPRAKRLRGTGCAALDLAWLAVGRVDAVLMLSNQPWDTAAGALMVQEAGGILTDLNGVTHSLTSHSLVAANPFLICELLQSLPHTSDIDDTLNLQ